ncbi:MAG: glycosyltransferase family 2 protein [Lachnospiraceae bacterium]|nr:glycosyltransferase family 2 protein [Lachnospiraceae bacterium]
MWNISVVIPCFNSDKTIEPVVDEIVSTIEDRLLYEIILVNDGSTSELWDAIKRLADKYPGKVKGIRFSRNFGQHSALMAGYRASKGDVIIQMDDDGQADPKGIFTLLGKIDEGYDTVYARYPVEKKAKWRSVGSEINRRMCISLIDMPKDLHPMSFAAYRRFVIDEMIRYDKPYPYVGGLAFRTTSNLCDVEIEHRERLAGRSNYTLRKLIRLWMNGFTAFSVKPLEIASLSGVVIALIGMLYAIVIIIKRICGFQYLEGWSSVIALTLLLDGFLLIMIGLVGEYIGRIYISLNNAPQYVIREEYGDTVLSDNK